MVKLSLTNKKTPQNREELPMGGEPLKQKEDDNEKIKSSGCKICSCTQSGSFVDCLRNCFLNDNDSGEQ